MGSHVCYARLTLGVWSEEEPGLGQSQAVGDVSMSLCMSVGVSEPRGVALEKLGGVAHAPSPTSLSEGTTPPTEPGSVQLGAVSSAPGASGAGIAEQLGLGFTSVIRHLSLAGWLRWIHSNRSDAELRVRTRDGGSGNIWCSAGRIVDAQWGALTAEEALHEMLRLPSGSVTIDFDGVDRPCRIARSTQDLLRSGEGGAGRSGNLTQAESTPVAWPSLTAREQPFGSSLSSSLTDAPHASSQRSPEPPSIPGSLPRSIPRSVYFASGLLLAALVMAAFALGRIRALGDSEVSRAPEPERAQQTTSGLLPPASPATSPPLAPTVTPPSTPTRRDLPVIPFVAVEVEPAHAKIWLDQVLVGVGRVELAPIPDGAMHELRFVAAGHETRSLFFLDAPPAGRVILERAIERTTSAVEGSNEGGEQREPVKNGKRRRAQLPPAPPPAALGPPAATSTEAKKSMQVELIEARTPRVQVLD
jgi:Domain of unknown function (DUF4388)